MALPGYDNADICIVFNEGNYKSYHLAYRGYHTVTARGDVIEYETRGMEGEHAVTHSVGFGLIHEIAHLFYLDHCSSPGCPMSMARISYNLWLEMEKKLWFCDEHAPLLLKNWRERNYR